MAYKSNQLYTPLNAATTTGASSVIDVSGLIAGVGVPGPTLTVIITGTATVQIQQSLDQATWITLATISASDSYVLLPSGLYYRVNVSAISSGSVTAQVGPGLTTGGMSATPAKPASNAGGPS